MYLIIVVAFIFFNLWDMNSLNSAMDSTHEYESRNDTLYRYRGFIIRLISAATQIEFNRSVCFFSSLAVVETVFIMQALNIETPKFANIK